MGPAVEPSTNSKQSTLQKALTSALNELGLDAALIAIHTGDNGPLVAQVSRGLTPRDTQAILRALSLQDVMTKSLEQSSRAEGGDSKVIRLRMITPGAKSLIAVPLQYQQRTYGMIVMGRKESAAFTKKEKALLESTAEDITKSLEQAS
ncbi:MAG: GAF domain-containing protein, partial [Nitrospirales bacterium]|nr:GAF domain-containing protein [Nitrospirales bacterium]